MNFESPRLPATETATLSSRRSWRLMSCSRAPCTSSTGSASGCVRIIGYSMYSNASTVSFFESVPTRQRSAFSAHFPMSMPQTNGLAAMAGSRESTVERSAAVAIGEKCFPINTLGAVCAECQTPSATARRQGLAAAASAGVWLAWRAATLAGMSSDRLIVLLPCHSLHDFPTWLDEQEADALLTAWTAAWHPELLAATGSVPAWASVDLPAPDLGAGVGIVPDAWDDRFAAQADLVAPTAGRWVRGVRDRHGLVAAAARLLGRDDVAAGSAVPAEIAEDFHALGLAVLLAELLAERMRSSAGLSDTAFSAAAVAAARAAVAGDAAAARSGLRECFGFLEATRAHYYPVDVWLLDIVLLAETTLGPGLDRELAAPVPFALVATGDLVDRLAARNAAAVARIRERCAAGTLEPAGGRDDDRPLDQFTPEEMVTSFDRGQAAWQEHVGTKPVTFARQSGGTSHLLPQLLHGLGYSGVVWPLFDGTGLPHPGGGRIRWEAAGGAAVDGVAATPLDARRAQTILGLAEKIGDCMDHEHTAVLMFAHHAGTASPWFECLRRIGGSSTVLGTFVTPAEFFRRTSGAGMDASFEPDAFPVGLPAEGTGQSTGADLITERVVAARAEAVRLAASREPARAALPGALSPGNPAAPPTADMRRPVRGRLFGLLPRRRALDDELVLEHAWLRVQVHRRTGGLLSLRRPADRGNRLSQRLAVKTTRPAPPVGHAWESPADRAIYSTMEADSVSRLTDANGQEVIESRGRFLDERHGEVGTFTQAITLVPDAAVAVMDIAVRPAASFSGPLFEHHAACRFAWNENDDADVRRSLHTQSVVTERARFTAPWFLEVESAAAPREAAGRISILTGGLPWHVRSSPHMLDSILPVSSSADGSQPCRLAIGIGLERPWEWALALLAGLPLGGVLADPFARAVSGNVRLTVAGVQHERGRLAAVRIGLLESAGRAGEVSVEWAADIAAVRGCDPLGLPGAAADDVGIAGRTMRLALARYQWRHLEVEFQG